MEHFDLEYAISILPDLLEAAIITVQATVFGFGLALAVGLILAIVRRSDSRLLSAPAGGMVEFLRSTPLLVQLFFLFYVLPRYGVGLPALTLGIIGLGLHYGAYTSEVYRAGIDAVTRGQWEAARALNFSQRQTWTKIVLPQAIPPMIPALGNYLIAMFKDTPLLAGITVVEMFNQAKIITAREFQPLESYTMVGLIFLLLSVPSVLLIQRLEARLGRPQ